MPNAEAVAAAAVRIQGLRKSYGEHEVLKGIDLEAYHNHQVTSYLSGRDNLFAKSSTGVRYEIGDLFYLTMSLNVDYERDPPPGVDTEDKTWVIGAGFEF